MEHIEAQRIAKKNVCGSCSGNLIIMQNKDGYYLRCVNGCKLDEVGLDTAWNHPSKREKECLAERNMSEMVMNISADKAVALRQYALTPRLDKAQAIEVLKACWPKAPETDVLRAALLCATYQLNPLMKHVFLVPYGQGDKATWSIQIGIGATRLAASRRGPVSYIDGPRIMSAEEQKHIRGKVDNNKIWAITKLGGRNGATSVGYGSYGVTETVQGEAKGNSRENMAMIRSERQALDRLYPAEMPMPADVETVDESFEKSPLAAVEGEYRDISEAKEIPASVAEKPAAAPEPAQAEDIPSEEIADPFPKITAKYGDLLSGCTIHGDAWSISKFKKRTHKTDDGWCNFADLLKPITEDTCKAAGIEDGLALNDKVKAQYEGRTWSKISEEEQLAMLESLLNQEKLPFS